MFSRITTLLVHFIVCAGAPAQPPQYNFRQLTGADGLSDPVVLSAAQDKYGLLWLGTVNGLSIYNGYGTRIIEAGSGSFAFRDNVVMSVCRDGNGNVWIAQGSGLYRYDYATAHFLLQPGTDGLSWPKLFAAAEGELLIATRKGLRLFSTQSGKVLSGIADDASNILLNTAVRDAASLDKTEWFLATDTGLVVYRSPTKSARLAVADARLKGLTAVAVEKSGRLWCTDGKALYRIDGGRVTECPFLRQLTAAVTENAINDLLVDASGRLWLATSRNGICSYEAATGAISSFQHDPVQPQSISANIINSLFQSSDGTVWAATAGYGMAYFNPDRNFFHTLLPSSAQSPTLPDNWCRAAAEDKAGRWWLATANGLAAYNPVTDAYTVFQNKEGGKKVLQSNSVRTVWCAGDGTVWIGTADGLNRYHPSTGRMDFIGEKEGVPLSFFWQAAEDAEGNVWFACRDGLYTYHPSTKTFDDNSNNAALKPYCRQRTKALFFDSKGDLWIGFDGQGLLRYNPKNSRVNYWRSKAGDSTGITGDFTSSIVEDKNGTVWISTTRGLSAYDAKAARFRQFTKADGLPSNIVYSLMPDDGGRLWIGTTKGLSLLDSGRTAFKNFGEEDGLPTLSFNEQSAARLRNGAFVFPTLKGFLYFNPAGYRDRYQAVRPLLTAFRVYNRDFPLPTNPEAVESINLHWNQSFFSFTVAAPDYLHPSQTAYAYWLEGFDKGWVYTKERTRNYTNVPGGDYTLRIKASSNAGDWAGPEIRIAVHVETVFYRQGWFVVPAAALLFALVYAVYRYRLRQQRQVMALQAKATALEKEKTLALYESLKQQLNPHFLFNSLSSLSGLIQRDQGQATAFLARLSKIYRYILKSGQTEKVKVSEDLKLAETYVQLQQTRFGSGLQLVVELDEETASRSLAPVTIQNLIENAIKHNVIDPETPLRIAISATDDFLVVQNNLQKKTFVEGSNKQGLQNMKNLYRYLTGKNIVIEEAAETFTVKIPFV